MTIVSTEPPQIPESRVSISDIDPYSDAALIEPWDAYRELRDLRPESAARDVPSIARKEIP